MVKKILTKIIEKNVLKKNDKKKFFTCAKSGKFMI